jgi:hypothetical protein
MSSTVVAGEAGGSCELGGADQNEVFADLIIELKDVSADFNPARSKSELAALEVLAARTGCSTSDGTASSMRSTRGGWRAFTGEPSYVAARIGEITASAGRCLICCVGDGGGEGDLPRGAFFCESHEGLDGSVFGVLVCLDRSTAFLKVSHNRTSRES